MPYAPRPRLSYPPAITSPQFITPAAPAPAPVGTASVTVTSSDLEYLQYSDPVIDDYHYNQQQILSVDNNKYAQYEEQTYQQSQTYCQAVHIPLQRCHVQPSHVTMQQQMVPYNQADAQLEVQHQQQQQQQHLAIEPPPPPPRPSIVHHQQQVQQPLAIKNPVLPVATAPAPTPLAAVSIADHQQQQQHQAYVLQTPVVSVAH